MVPVDTDDDETEVVLEHILRLGWSSWGNVSGTVILRMLEGHLCVTASFCICGILVIRGPAGPDPTPPFPKSECCIFLCEKHKYHLGAISLRGPGGLGCLW